MGYGEIIKRAWRITWRYRALWVLGLFAGVTGTSGGGGGGGGNYNLGSLGSNSGSGTSKLPSGLSGPSIVRAFERFLPLLIVVFLGLIVIGIVWWILSVAARGGLVFAVNEVEDGRPLSLGWAWNAGFARFWSIFGLALLLALPVIALLFVILLVILLPIVVPLMSGGKPSPMALVPMCGTLAIGIPLLIVLSIVLGLLHELALRYVMLSGHGAFQAVGESWRAFRSRFKDTALMYLIAVGLNIAAGIVIAIPLVIVALVIIVPAVVAAIAGKWAAFAAVIVVAVLLVSLLSLAFTAVWGTFTSALWTVFFRRFTGMEMLSPAEKPAPPAPPAEQPAAPAPPVAPPPPGAPAPPAAPQPPPPPPAAAPEPAL